MDRQLSRYSIRNPEEVYDLAYLLSRNFPEPNTSLTGIYELLMNAIEHGLLGIGYEAKALLLRYGKLPDEMRRRLLLPENADKTVEVLLEQDNNACRLTIIDGGYGFNWQDRIRETTQSHKQLSPHGRGLMITLNCGFDELRYNPTGNEVTLMCRKMVDAARAKVGTGG